MKTSVVIHAKINRNWFNRLLVSQAIIDEMSLITAESEIQNYSFNHLKA